MSAEDYYTDVVNWFINIEDEVYDLIGKIIFDASVEYKLVYSQKILLLKDMIHNLPKCNLVDVIRENLLLLEKEFLCISDADLLFLNISRLFPIITTGYSRKILKDYSKEVTKRVKWIYMGLEKLAKRIQGFDVEYQEFLRKEEVKKRKQEGKKKQEEKQINEKKVVVNRNVGEVCDQEIEVPVLVKKSSSVLKIEARVNKILRHLDSVSVKGRILTDKQKDNLHKIIADLEQESIKFSNDWDTLCQVRSCSYKVASLLEKDVQKINKKEENIFPESDNFELKEEMKDVDFTKNQEMLQALEYLLSTMDYKISNTIQKTNSYGDGTFVTQMLRPILYALKNEIFSKNTLVLGEKFSWNEIISTLRNSFDNRHHWQLAFLRALQDSKVQCSTIWALFYQMFEVIQKISQESAVFSYGAKWDSIALKNLTKQFVQFMHSTDMKNKNP